MEKKTSEAQRKASKKWNYNNKEAMKKIRYRSGAKNYIPIATKEELLELEQLIAKRKAELEESGK